jgi:hypothetical protein
MKIFLKPNILNISGLAFLFIGIILSISNIYGSIILYISVLYFFITIILDLLIKSFNKSAITNNIIGVLSIFGLIYFLEYSPSYDLDLFYRQNFDTEISFNDLPFEVQEQFLSISKEKAVNTVFNLDSRIKELPFKKISMKTGSGYIIYSSKKIFIIPSNIVISKGILYKTFEFGDLQKRPNDIIYYKHNLMDDVIK